MFLIFIAFFADYGRPSVSAPKAPVAVDKGSESNDSVYDTAEDEILEACVKTATARPVRKAPRERKRARNRDRKSCKYHAGTFNNLNSINHQITQDLFYSNSE